MFWIKTVFQACSFFCCLHLLKAQGSQCSANDCGGCIRASSQCHWCSDTNFTLGENAGRQRCDLLSALKPFCNSTTEDIKTIDGQPLKNDDYSDQVQIRPQEVLVALRPGDQSTFQLNVKPAENFPVDLYFIMDISASMSDDLANLQKLGKDIAEAIKRMTTNYRFGFGSFVDKLLPPYIQPASIHPDFPCSHPYFKRPGVKCRPAFSYIHFLNFTNNITAFQETVRNQNLSGEIDPIAGGFDGLMQTAACENELGWQDKKKARRIVVYVSDSLPKIAGDAKLAGLVMPNDGLCHVVKQSNDEASLLLSNSMDYPSIGHLKQVMLSSAIVPIIAITKDVRTTYEQIRKEWDDLNAAIGELTSDSSNIVDLIKENYAKISTTVRFIADQNDNLKVSYKLVNCPNGNPSIPNECQNVLKSQEVSFNVTITALKCPDDPAKNTDEFKIRTTSGFGDVTVKVKYLCDCSCASKAISNSPLCSNNGTFECGICKCNAGRYGATCQCDQTNLGTESNNTAPCKGPDNTTCSNNGNCVCGKCECFKQSDATRVITGQFCECSNFNCPKYQGIDCGGNVRGTCDCGNCKCLPLYYGNNCGQKNCSRVTKEKCIKDGQQCSDHGSCDCESEKCVCQSRWTGNYCETCFVPPCDCASIHDCVLCSYSPQTNINCTGCQNYTFQEVLKSPYENLCTLSINESCLIYYDLNLITNNSTMNNTMAISAPVCVAMQKGDDHDILAIILGIIAGILLLGLLLLLLWKLLTHIHDKRDYEKFKKSQQESQWEKGGNPIYREPNQQFENPAFAGNN